MERKGKRRGLLYVVYGRAVVRHGEAKEWPCEDVSGERHGGSYSACLTARAIHTWKCLLGFATHIALKEVMAEFETCLQLVGGDWYVSSQLVLQR
jgi:hypothetical protein